MGKLTRSLFSPKFHIFPKKKNLSCQILTCHKLLGKLWKIHTFSRLFEKNFYRILSGIGSQIGSGMDHLPFSVFCFLFLIFRFLVSYENILSPMKKEFVWQNIFVQVRIKYMWTIKGISKVFAQWSFVTCCVEMSFSGEAKLEIRVALHDSPGKKL